MKSQAVANIGFAVALLGTLLSIDGGYRIAVLTVVAALVLAAVALLLHDRFRSRFWKRLVNISSNIHTTYTALGFGVCTAGVKFLTAEWLSAGILFVLAGALLIGAGIGQGLLLLKRTIRTSSTSSAVVSNSNQITGAWRECSFAGLQVVAYPTGKKGLYFTDEIIKVTFELTNTTFKQLKGKVTFFYGFGPSGVEGKTFEQVPFDLQPKGIEGNKVEVTALERLIGVQGNCIIGWLLQPTEQSAIESETDEQIVLKPPEQSSKFFHTLYTFVSYNREFYQRVYIRQEELMKLTVRLAIVVIVLATLTLLVGLTQILNSFQLLPPS